MSHISLSEIVRRCAAVSPGMRSSSHSLLPPATDRQSMVSIASRPRAWQSYNMQVPSRTTNGNKVLKLDMRRMRLARISLIKHVRNQERKRLQ